MIARENNQSEREPKTAESSTDNPEKPPGFFFWAIPRRAPFAARVPRAVWPTADPLLNPGDAQRWGA
jgi:hypothetical protein